MHRNRNRYGRSSRHVPFPRRALRYWGVPWLLIASLAFAPPGWASPAWRDGKAYTAMLADGGAAALKAVTDAIDKLKQAKALLAEIIQQAVVQAVVVLDQQV